MRPVTGMSRLIDLLGPAEVHQRVHGRTDRPAREEHVVDEDDLLAVQREGDVRLAELARPAGFHDVVPVQRDVELARGDGNPFDPGDLLPETLGQQDPTLLDSHQDKVFDPLVPLEDLVGDPRQGALDPFGIHDDLAFFHVLPFSGSRPVPSRRAKKPSRHPGRSSVFGPPFAMFTLMGATFFNLAGLLLKGRGTVIAAVEAGVKKSMETAPGNGPAP